jgi:integrase
VEEDDGSSVPGGPEGAGFLVLLEWFENFRLRHELPAGRDAAKAFWKSEVIRVDREREKWQLAQWADAIQWYLNWLSACSETGADHRSLAERVRLAVYSSGARRGLLKRTKQCYGAWAARYARFAGSEQAVFGVKLRDTGTRVPVVLSKPETHRLLEKLRERDQRGMHYELAGRLQYGAGLRLSELIRLRVQDVDVGRGTVTVRLGKGDKDRVTVLPKSLREEVARQIERARMAWAW